MKSVLFVIPEFGVAAAGGIASFYNALVPNLAAKGIEVSVCALPGSVPEELRPAGVRMISVSEDHRAQGMQLMRRLIHFPATFNLLSTAYSAYYACKDAGPFDIVETVDFGLAFVPWLTQSETPPTVVQLHGSTGQVSYYDAIAGEELAGFLCRLLETALLPRAEALWSLSKANATEWSSLLNRSVDLIRPIMPQSAGIAAAHRHIGPTAGERSMTVGRLQRWKGPHELCTALRTLPRGALTAEWYGSDHVEGRSQRPMSAALSEAFPDQWNQNFVWKGKVSRDTLAQKRLEIPLVICPSLWDTLNIAVLESMAAGQIVLVSDGAGVAELITPGETGFVFKSSDPAELAKGIEELLGLSAVVRKRIGDAAAHTISETLCGDAVIDDRIAHYERVIESATGRQPHDWLNTFFAAQTDEGDWDLTKGIPFRALSTAMARRVVNRLM